MAKCFISVAKCRNTRTQEETIQLEFTDSVNCNRLVKVEFSCEEFAKMITGSTTREINVNFNANEISNANSERVKLVIDDCSVNSPNKICSRQELEDFINKNPEKVMIPSRSNVLDKELHVLRVGTYTLVESDSDGFEYTMSLEVYYYE